MKLLLNSLYEIGKLWFDKENLDKIDVLLDAKKLKITEKVILVELNQINESFEFNRVFLKDYDPQDNLKYLYKSGSSRGTDITPSCLITEPGKSLLELLLILFIFELFNFLLILSLVKTIELSLTELSLSNSNTLKLLLN